MSAIKQHWFFVGLLLVFFGVLADGTLSVARVGIFLKDHQGPAILIVMIFLFSGLIIEIDQIRAGIRDIRATLAALVLIFVAAPLLAAGMIRLPMETGVSLGLLLVAAMPTTLSSGVVMTGQAGGNIAHALFVTLLANAAAIVSIPLTLPLLVSPLHLDASLAIDQRAVFIRLLVLVLLPLGVGMGLKHRLPPISFHQKRRLGQLNQAIVLTIVFISFCTARPVLVENARIALLIVPLTVAFHGMLLAMAGVVCRLLKLGPGRREAVIFMGAQKTLPLSVMLQITLFPEYGSALLVCVLHHLIHLMMDSYLAVRMRP